MASLNSLKSEQLQKHLEGFLIDHWSVSAVQEFIRNEKSFERRYIFRDKEKDKSLASIIGIAYHEALMHFFLLLKNENRKMSIDELLFAGHAALEKFGANVYRPQKGKTIEQLQQEALKRVNDALKAFLTEFDIYEDEIEEILFVEERFKNFVSINGVEVPVPLKIGPDLVFVRKKTLTLAVFDHKAKKNWTKESDADVKYGNLAMSYTLGLNVAILEYKSLIEKYPRLAEGVKDFFFYENKYIKNRNGARQIKRIDVDIEKSGPLLEQILFEGVSRMIEAVQNPDYIYLMNPADHYQDSGEMLEFWIKTHIEGLDGFPRVKPRVRKMLEKRKTQIRRSALTGISKSIVRSFTKPKDFITFNLKDMENLTYEERIEHRLAVFNYPVKVGHKVPGYSCDTYLVKVGAAVKTSGIFAYRMDIANALGVKDVRILKSLIEYNGDVYIAIEVEKKDRVNLSLDSAQLSSGNVFPLGKDNFGKTWEWSIDNPSTPHLMIAGASGSGKSVAIKSIIRVAKEKGIEVAILDPKFEFLSYRGEATVINELGEIELFMAMKVKEMDKIFKTSGAIGNSGNKQLIIFDESADCFARQTKQQFIISEGPKGGMKKIIDTEFKTLEENTLILAQKARSAGIHLVLAAQRFSVKVLTGDAKANFATRLCLMVTSAVDSKVMLDQEGAEKLAGKGDALLSAPGIGEPVRIQCFAS